MAAPPRDIPLPVKRQLRQESGFGCCICGSPILEYHHIRPFAEYPEHDPQHMITLCPTHHHEATAGGITEEEQRQSKSNPINIQRGYAEGLLRITDPALAVHVATNDFVGPGFKLVVDDQPLLALDRTDAGRLHLSLDLFDQDDNLIISIVNNEWIAGDPMPWDIEFVVRCLTIRRRHGDVALRLDARATPVILQGDLWRKRQHFSLRPDGLYFNGVLRDIGFIELGLVALGIHVDTTVGHLELKPDARFGKAMIVSLPDRAQRLMKCFEALERLEREASEQRPV